MSLFLLLLHGDCILLKSDSLLTDLRDKKAVPPPAAAAYFDSSKPNIQKKHVLFKTMSAAALLPSKSGKNSTALPDLNGRLRVPLRTVTVITRSSHPHAVLWHS